MILRKIFNKVFFVIFGSDVLYAQVAKENWFFMRIAYNACRSFRLNCALPLNVNGYKLRVRPRSPDLQVALTSLGEEYDMLLRYSTDERCLVLDAGGYIGTSALKLSEIFPAATTVSVEPFSQNYSLLIRNTKRNHNIVPLNCALASADKDEKIGLFDRGTGQWGATILENPADRNAEHVENVSTRYLSR